MIGASYHFIIDQQLLAVSCTTACHVEVCSVADDNRATSFVVCSKSLPLKKHCSSAIPTAPLLSFCSTAATHLSTSNSSVLPKPKASFDFVSPSSTRLHQSPKGSRPPLLFPIVSRPANTSTHSIQSCTTTRSSPQALASPHLWISNLLLKLLQPPR